MYFYIIKSWNKSLIALPLLLISLSSAANISVFSDQAQYSPRIELSAKAGKYRHIVRPGFVLPIYQKKDFLIHTTVIGMADTTKAIEGNFGIGFRTIVNQNIVGGFAFYDISKTSRDNLIYQLTLGAEWFMDYLEFRANVYLPSTTKFFYDNKVSTSYRKASAPRNKIEMKTTNNHYFEQALRGFDVDLGSQVPGLEALTVRVAYYHFGFNNKTETRHGARLSANYQILGMLDIDTEISYDNQRKLTYFGGLTLNYQFDGSEKQMTRLQQKMNALPIRDIDAVTGKGSVDIQEVARFHLYTGAKALVGHSYDGSVDVVKLDDNGEFSVITSRHESINNHVLNTIKALPGDVLQSAKYVLMITDESGKIYDVTEGNEELSTARPVKNEADLLKRASALVNLITSVVSSKKEEIVNIFLTKKQKTERVESLKTQIASELEILQALSGKHGEALAIAKVAKSEKMLDADKQMMAKESAARKTEEAQKNERIAQEAAVIYNAQDKQTKACRVKETAVVAIRLKNAKKEREAREAAEKAATKRYESLKAEVAQKSAELEKAQKKAEQEKVATAKQQQEQAARDQELTKIRTQKVQLKQELLAAATDANKAIVTQAKMDELNKFELEVKTKQAENNKQAAISIQRQEIELAKQKASREKDRRGREAETDRRECLKSEVEITEVIKGRVYAGSAKTANGQKIFFGIELIDEEVSCDLWRKYSDTTYAQMLPIYLRSYKKNPAFKTTGFNKKEYDAFIKKIHNRFPDASSEYLADMRSAWSGGISQLYPVIGQYIAYAAKAPVKGYFNHPNNIHSLKQYHEGYKNLLMTVKSDRQPGSKEVYTNRGISRHIRNFIFENDYKGISLILHGFTAQFFHQYFQKTHMGVAPMPKMRNLLCSKLKTSEVYVSDDIPTKLRGFCVSQGECLGLRDTPCVVKIDALRRQYWGKSALSDTSK